MKLIPLTKGYFAKIDDEDYERINAFKWFVVETITGPNKVHTHACRWTLGSYPNRRMIRMHHEVLDIDARDLVKRKELIDHDNRDGIDNQKHNLVISNKVKNAINSDRVINAKGIYYEARRNRYKAFLLNPKRYVGTFKTLEEAKIARDRALCE